jgi:hypothetical protein
MPPKNQMNLLGLIAVIVFSGVTGCSASYAEKFDPATGRQFLGLTLQLDSLADVQKKFGQTSTIRCSSADSSPYEVCYRIVDSGVRIVFLSTFPAESLSDKLLVGYKILPVDTGAGCYKQCPLATVSRADLQVGGIRIGMSQQEVLGLLGEPKRISGNQYTFWWLESRSHTPRELSLLSSKGIHPGTVKFDFLDTIRITFEQGRVNSLEVYFAVTS